MLKNFVAVATAFVVLAFSVSSADASVITFDDYTAGVSTGRVINDGYKDLSWDNFYALDGVNYSSNPSGYQAGVVSSNNVAYNGYGNDAVISASNAFNFNSAYFTGAWNDDLSITVKGYLDGVEQYSNTFVVDSTKPSFVAFNWAGINSVVFSADGGVKNSDYAAGTGTHFAMDNLDISNVPVPAALPLFGFGLAGVSGLRIRRKRKDQSVAHA